KGKCDPGESDEACALREVEEETGFRCELLDEIGRTEYVDSRGRPKRVRWWLMRPTEGEFSPGDEVDAVRWTPPAGAIELLSNDRDLPLLERIASLDDAVACTHGDVIEAVLGRDLPKGGAVVLDGGREVEEIRAP